MLNPTLIQLFAAENDRDWPAFAELLDPDVTWHLVGERTHTITGREAYMARIQRAYEARPSAHFELERFRQANDGRVLVELIDDQGAVSVEIFELRDGRVTREWEFLFGPSDR